MRTTSQAKEIGFRLLSLPAVLFALFLTGCGPQAEAPPIRVATSYWIGYEPFYQAEEYGFFPDGTVHLVETPNALGVEQTMRGGTIDALALSLSRTLQYIEQGHAVSIVMVLGWSEGADKILARPELSHITDLKGKKVGTELATVNSYLLFRALENHGLALPDIQITELSNEGMEDSYLKGNIDAASVHSRAATLIEEAGANVLYDSGEIPGEIADVLVVRNKFIEKYPKRVQQLVDGWMKAVAHMKERAATSTIQPFLMKDADFAADYGKVKLAGYDENKAFLANDSAKLKELVEKRRAFQKAFNMPPPPTTVDFINGSAFAALDGGG
ncbi:MAG: ABC transporter substrate-binding protein [Kordiimonas sp.]